MKTTSPIRSLLPSLFLACIISSSAWADWSTPWRWNANKVSAEESHDQLIVNFSGERKKGGFIERVIPADWITQSEGEVAVLLDLDILELQDNETLTLAFMIKAPGELTYKEDDPVYLNIRFQPGQPTKFTSLAKATPGKNEERIRHFKAVTGLTSGSKIGLAFRMNLKTGDTIADVSANSEKFQLFRQVAPQWETHAAQGLILRIKPIDKESGTIKLSIKGQLDGPSSSP